MKQGHPNQTTTTVRDTLSPDGLNKNDMLLPTSYWLTCYLTYLLTESITHSSKHWNSVSPDGPKKDVTLLLVSHLLAVSLTYLLSQSLTHNWHIDQNSGTLSRDVKSHSGAQKKTFLWGQSCENFWILLFKITHSGVLYVSDERLCPQMLQGDPNVAGPKENSPHLLTGLTLTHLMGWMEMTHCCWCQTV